MVVFGGREWPNKGEVISYSEGLYSVELNPGLSDWEVNDAWALIRWLKGAGPFFGIAGTMLVSGPRRQGKGLFANVFAWKVKRYFKGKKILRDDHAPALFGEYILFNEDTLLAEVEAMSEVAETNTEETSNGKKTKMTAAARKVKLNEWRTSGQGEIVIQNSVILKDEFWKDMNKRRPGTMMNLLFGGMLKTCYHIDTLVVGIIQRTDDLDRFTCLPDVNLHVKCTWCDIRERPDTTRVAMQHVQWSAAQQRLIPLDGRPFVIYLNGATPQEALGGLSYFDLFHSKNAPNMRSLVSTERMKLMTAGVQ